MNKSYLLPYVIPCVGMSFSAMESEELNKTLCEADKQMAVLKQISHHTEHTNPFKHLQINKKEPEPLKGHMKNIKALVL